MTLAFLLLAAGSKKGPSDKAGSNKANKVTLTRDLAPPLLTAEVTGKVVINQLIAVKKIQVQRDTDKCGREKVDETWSFARDLGLRHAIVWLEGVPARHMPTKPPTITIQQITCSALPRVTATTVGATLELRNLDAVQHQAHAFYMPLALGPAESWFAMGLPTKGVGLRKTLERTGFIHLANEAAHPYLEAWIGVFDHTWFIVTDEVGRFSFSGVPYGRYELKTWHEAGGIASRAIQVDSAGVSDIVMTYDPTKGMLRTESIRP